ncbi:MAG: ATP phosphoribosyltransferase regulatory subunit [Oscillospiraceae bacterium]|nr:ATP phosphoribosyltransferase regulatory subunit [Oscillospiraceae bacterium]
MTSAKETQTALRPAERATLELRGLYERFGYKKYRVSQFEEYGLYLQYQSFLPGGRMLTFTDLDGRLLALKPDVTISIIKNARLPEGCTEKAYYIENVYRESKTDGSFKEISQMGLEYLGAIDDYAVAETLLLAQETLRCIGPAWLLEISHMGFVGGLFDALGLGEEARRDVLESLTAKSRHGVGAAAQRAGLGKAGAAALETLCTLSGGFAETAAQAEKLCLSEKMRTALQELKTAAAALDDLEHVRLDFTLQGDMDYYDGVMMCGYLEGVPGPVLAGGRYDSLVKKLGKQAGAVGYALYLDELERLPVPKREYDVDVLLLAEKDADTAALLREVRRLTAEGLRVRVEHTRPCELRCRRVCRFTKEGVSEC